MRFVSLLIIIFLFLFPISSVYSQESSMSANVQVNGVSSMFDKLQEKITMFFKFTPEEKVQYQKYLVEKRYAEFLYIMKEKDYDYIEETTSRYNTYLGQLTQLVKENNINNPEIDEMIKRQEGAFEQVQKNFDFDSGWWLSIQHAINTAKDTANKI